jgi:transcriptional regulator with XRE-family HTH domain
MIDPFTALDEGDDSAPNTALDLSSRMRELRARQGLKQSEVARRMGLDPSIPSLWEQGKRPVPANRVQSLADALGVPVDELISGIDEAGALRPPAGERGYRLGPDIAERRYETRDVPLFTVVGAPEPAPEPAPVDEPEPAPPVETFEIAERPPLIGWIPEGWEPRDRVQDISPSLPDGYWLDPVKLERPSAKQMLRSRLCADDQAIVEGQLVPGAALAERIYAHCSRLEGFESDRFPLIESIFRAVLAAEHGGLTDAALVETLSARQGAVPLTTQLLRRLRDSVRPYPMRSIDRSLFE